VHDQRVNAPRLHEGSLGLAATERREQRVVLVVRAAVVLSWIVIIVVDPSLGAGHRTAVWVLSGIGVLYAATLLTVRLADVWEPPNWSIPLIDSVLTLAGCALLGGATSLLVAVLPLIVISAGLGGRRGYLVAIGLGVGYLGAILWGSPGLSPIGALLHGLWWLGYLLATAVLVEVFSRLLERQYDLATQSRAEAIAEHEALLEERDLRERLAESQQSRHDGLRVILHEFRTPVTSMSALSRDLASGTLPEAAAAKAATLIAAHTEHLRDMLDNLADLALADGSPVGRSRSRNVVLTDLAEVVFDAAGIPPERRSRTIVPDGATAHTDPQLLRRVLTNLAENAARHSGTGLVELHLRTEPLLLVAEVRDRGPGLPPEQLGQVSRKYVSLGERRGTAGLGLWIAAQLTTSARGQLTLSTRDGGGLVARLELPLVSGRRSEETAAR
jgi:signal transduction histidine kinase